MPIDWPEPFGLVMIEAMACGTPVIAFNRGSVAEIDRRRRYRLCGRGRDQRGRGGRPVSGLDRAEIRKVFEQRFTARRMALDYLAAYRSLMEAAKPHLKLVSSAE